MEIHITHPHQALVKKCKTGHTNSQYELYSLYVDAMYNVCLRMLGNKEDAEDVVQESFIVAFKNLGNFKFESTFGTWLKRIVINRSINFLKVKRIQIIPMDAAEFHITEEVPEQNETVDIEKVKKAIDKLPQGYKQIISLYLIEGYDHVEIGEVLNISVSTSKSQYHRAKKKLIGIINTL